MNIQKIVIFMVLTLTFSGLGNGQEPIKLKVVVDDARVNAEPEIGGNTLARLPLNTIVTAVEKTGEWYKVDLEHKGVGLSGYMHEMLVAVVTDEELAEAERPALSEKTQEDIIREIETVMDENRNLIRQNEGFEDAILSLRPLVGKAFRVKDDKRQRELAAEIFLWIGMAYAGQDQYKSALNEIRNMYEAEYGYAKEITRNIYDPKIICLIQHAEKEYLGQPSEFALEIKTIPDKAKVVLNGKNAGFSSGMFKAGSPIVKIEITKEGHEPVEDEVFIWQDMERKEYRLTSLGRNLVVKTKPVGAKLFFDGEETAELTNCTLPFISFGPHRIRIIKENYREWTQEINVEKDTEPFTLEIVLTGINYRFLDKWGGPDSQVFEKPLEIVINKDGHIYVLDESDRKIKKFTTEGRLMPDWRLHGPQYKGIKSPYGLAVDSDGNVYVTDVKENCVWKFDGDGAFIAKWGRQGNAKEEFLRPTGIAVNTLNDVYVIDSGNFRVKIYSGSGELRDVWKKPGNVVLPYALALNRSDEVFILDKLKAYRFSPQGELVASWGRQGNHDGEFGSPKGICTDSDNFLYIADTLNNRIQKFDADGNFVAKWGLPGKGDGELMSPMSAAVDVDGRVYVVDGDNNRVQIYHVAASAEE
ncbi:MAG: PEGA domain-containing protein [Candidatus Aminicenantes bacterium]|nr:PEGA domain-containing protein [Candidatus Aminicenantes bacterium]